MRRQLRPLMLWWGSGTWKNARSITLPIMIPNAVHICLPATKSHSTAEHTSISSTVTQHSPHHHKRTPNNRRRALRRIYRHRRALGPNTEAEDKARDEEVLPGVGDALPDAGREREEGGDEDRAAAAEPFVQRGGEPAAEDAAAELHGKEKEMLVSGEGDGGGRRD